MMEHALAHLRMMMTPTEKPDYTLEFLSADFEGGARLIAEDLTVAEGTTRQCIDALDRLIDMYETPFCMKMADGCSKIVLLRTAQQRASGMSCIVPGTRGH